MPASSMLCRRLSTSVLWKIRGTLAPGGGEDYKLAVHPGIITKHRLWLPRFACNLSLVQAEISRNQSNEREVHDRRAQNRRKEFKLHKNLVLAAKIRKEPWKTRGP